MGFDWIGGTGRWRNWEWDDSLGGVSAILRINLIFLRKGIVVVLNVSKK